jgi:hypothetical protein
MIIRAIGHFPDYRMFFARFRNDFDLFLAISTSIIQIPAISSSVAYPWLTILQLLRWYRFILAFPRMRPLVVSHTRASEASLTSDDSVWQLYRAAQHGHIPVLGKHDWRHHGGLRMPNTAQADRQAVQLFRGDLEAGETITFSQTYNSFLGMYQVSRHESNTR